MQITVEDRATILDLYARYAHTFDAGDAEGWASCFTSDGTFVSLAGDTYEGRSALIEWVRQCQAGHARSGIRTRHWMTNHLLDADHGEVRGLAYLLLLGITQDGPIRILMSAVYHDILRVESGQWRFGQRSEELDRPWEGVQAAYDES